MRYFLWVCDVLMGLAIADGCRKYGATLLRRILLCVICLLSSTPKGAQDVQLWEMFRAQLCPQSISFMDCQEPEEWNTPLASSGPHMFPGRFWMCRYWCFHELVWRNAHLWSFAGSFARVKPDLGPHQPKAAELQHPGLSAFLQIT